MDDKKKITVIGALALVIVAVGAFQFLSPSGPATVAGKKDAKKTALKGDGTDESAGPKYPLLADNLPDRDPFVGPDLTDPTKPLIPPTTAPKGPSLPAAKRGGSNRWSPPPLGGPGFSPLPLSGQVGGNMASPGGLANTAPKEPEFAFTLSGVIVGHRPAAVFRDAQGNQRLIPMGGALDGDTHVESVSEGEVRVRYRGKTLRLSMGGNPVAK